MFRQLLLSAALFAAAANASAWSGYAFQSNTFKNVISGQSAIVGGQATEGKGFATNRVVAGNSTHAGVKLNGPMGDHKYGSTKSWGSSTGRSYGNGAQGTDYSASGKFYARVKGHFTSYSNQ